MKKGFTLVETLITLGVIGLVAALTIPDLIQNYKIKATVSILKKTYAQLDQGFRLAININDTVENWISSPSETPEASTEVMNKLKPHIKLINDCGTSIDCPRAENIYDYSKNNIYISTLNNGVRLYLNVQEKDCNWDRGDTKMLQNSCGWIDADINGDKGPNKMGIDIFEFVITKYGLIPYGVDVMRNNLIADYAKDKPSYFEATCQNLDTQPGFGCAGWVIYNENMDYLKCHDLSWKGKTKCE